MFEHPINAAMMDHKEEHNLLSQLVQPLLAWYDANARILPWREDTAPYRVWISEIMLQQTRVETVKPYFERFMKKLPTIQALAEVEEEALLKLWEGLGYYNRARNLKKAANVIQEQYGGNFPAVYEEMLKLPGIGSYTAGAISSIAFGMQVPAVDGNVLRVISRVIASEEDIANQSVKKKMEEALRSVMPQTKSGAFNQALMEIGATVCVPNGQAKCEICPLNQLCLAKKRDMVMDLPKKTLQKPRKIEEKTILVIKAGDKVALRKRENKGLLAGLYEFPNVEGHLTEDEVLNLIRKMSLSPIRIQKLESSKHIFTHREWHMTGFVIKVEELEQMEEQQHSIPFKNNLFHTVIFVHPEETKNQYPIPTAFQQYTKYMNMVLGNQQFVKV